MQPPVELDGFFTRSMALALAAVGAAADLYPLEWRARTLQGEVVLQGSPRPAPAPPSAVCEQWAAVLGLDEFFRDELEGVSIWSRYESPWLIEVSTRPL